MPGCHVLLVEDSSLIVEALRVLLEQHGHQVTTADSLESAHAALRAAKPDVVLLDIVLPDGDGLELARIRNGGSRPVLLALTGHADDSTRQRCLEAGCDAVLVKPVGTAELLTTIQQYASR